MSTARSRARRKRAGLNAIVARMRRDDGFTLIELLIGTVILGIISGAIAQALIVGFTTTGDTSQRFSESHDAQISSAYLANDVQSAKTVSVAAGGSSCASATNLVDLTYSDGKVASYSCGPSGGETRVTRTFDGTTVVLAHFAGVGKPTVTCSPSCGTSTPVRVDIAFTEASGYSFTLVGSQRLTKPSSPPPPPGGGATADVTLFVLPGVGGSNTPLWVSGGCPPGQIDNPGNLNNDCTSDSEQGPLTRPHLTVRGNLYVNSPVNGAVRLSGMKSQEKLAVSDGGDFKILQGGTCQGCTPQTVTCPACSTFPYGSYSPALLDPLRFMAPPPQSGPGIYVHTGTFNISGNTSLPAGIHILKAGMNVNGNANVSVSGTGGIMFYNESGSISFAGGSRFNLPAYDAAPYKNILIFQARTNTNDLSLSGGTNVASKLGGVIYAPNAGRVVLGTGGANLEVTAVIAQGIKVIGTTQVTIGPPVAVSIPGP
jgi:prepilin-type N-terminal cleavage/methylation domain-containing protein